MNGYRWHTGSVAWLLHRLTGLALTLYIVLHIWVVHHLSLGPGEFDEMMAAVQSPLFRLLEVGLLATVLFHSFNGLRILLFDIGVAVKAQRKVFWAAVVLTIGALVYGGERMLSHFMR